MKMPKSSTGAWPAFWLMSTTALTAVSPASSAIEEVDVVEWYGVNNEAGHRRPVVQQASHNYLPDHTENPPGTEFLYEPHTTVPGDAFPSDEFHVYGVDIEKKKVTWYIDGVKTNEISTPTSFMTGPFYIMLDYALGGGYPLTGVVDHSTMEVDWVRAYSSPER